MGFGCPELSSQHQQLYSQSPLFIIPGWRRYCPEGIAYDDATGYYYVSSTAGGTIYRGRIGEVATVFLEGGSDGRNMAGGMKVDGQGRLFIGTGPGGQVYVYDTRTAEHVATLTTPRTGNFVNDVALTPDGSAYFTDSWLPVLYRVAPDSEGTLEIMEYLNFNGTALEYQPGFNVNGIVASADGQYLIVAQMNGGKLFRITIATQEIREIDLGGRAIYGDGLVLDRRMLYAVDANREITVVHLAKELESGEVLGAFADPTFAFPTTIAKYRNRLLVVNSQFDRAGGPYAAPDAPPSSTPFAISDVAIPDQDGE
ncbi:MAG TPA: SMP-30/gluconolactonase/LRE family protein [Herpetosiphonaceae bacterium]|nr:SMP-30/gluconolactonase/LRE family protein [Herpetosiphonaceae bacterium]